MKTVALCFLLCFLGATTGLPTKGCPEHCPGVYAPICASDGHYRKTFDNDCKLFQFNCLKSQNYRQIRFGPCSGDAVPRGKQRDRWSCGMCPQVYSPVCASDGYETQTFYSMCTLEVHNCLTYRKYRAVQNGHCQNKVLPQNIQRKKPDCGGKCPELYTPVCGYDGRQIKEFYNQCKLDVQNCLHPNNKFIATKNGFCY